MNANTKNKKLSSEIADLIVQLVDQTDGPVTLAQVERDVPGFAKDGTPNWCYSIVGSGTDYLVWNGMSDQGRLALRKIISERRVAIQHVSALPYLLLDSRVIDDDAWMPTVLLPKKPPTLPHLTGYTGSLRGHAKPLLPRPSRREHRAIGLWRQLLCALRRINSLRKACRRRPEDDRHISSYPPARGRYI